MRLFPNFFFGNQNMADAKGGTEQQHLLTKKRETLAFQSRVLHPSWPTDGNGTDSLLKISAGMPEIDRHVQRNHVIETRRLE